MRYEAGRGDAADLQDILKARHDATKLHLNVASRHEIADIIVFLVATQRFRVILLRRGHIRRTALGEHIRRTALGGQH